MEREIEKEVRGIISEFRFFKCRSVFMRNRSFFWGKGSIVNIIVIFFSNGRIDLVVWFI